MAWISGWPGPPNRADAPTCHPINCYSNWYSYMGAEPVICRFTNPVQTATMAGSAEKLPMPRDGKLRFEKENTMGDKSPKSTQKKSNQKQAKSKSVAAKKKAVTASKSAAGKK